MIGKFLLAAALCAGLLFCMPSATPAAHFGVAASVADTLETPVIEVRGGRHWRRFWRIYRHRQRMQRLRHHRRWHHHRQAERSNLLRFETPRRGSGRPTEAAPAPKPAPAPKAPTPTLF